MVVVVLLWLYGCGCRFPHAEVAPLTAPVEPPPGLHSLTLPSANDMDIDDVQDDPSAAVVKDLETTFVQKLEARLKQKIRFVKCASVVFTAVR